MAHNIETVNGKSSFVSFMQPAWHGLGTILQEAMTVEHALEQGGLGFEVKKAPNTHIITLENEVQKIITSDTSFFTYRTDRNEVLGSKVGKDYTVLQNVDALNMLDIIKQEDENFTFQTAGSLRQGCQVFVTAKVPSKIVIGSSDEVEQYLVFSNSHDGNSGVKVFFSPIRVVCNNTLSMAIRGANNVYSIKHTTNVKGNFNEALKVMGFAKKNSEIATEQFNALAKVKMSQRMFWDYVGNVFLSDSEIKAIKSGEDKKEVISTQKKKVINEVLEYAETGVGQAEAGEGTAWWAFNAVTGYMSNVKGFKSAEKRFEGLLSSSTIDKALTLAGHTNEIVNLTLNSTGLVSGISLN